MLTSVRRPPTPDSLREREGGEKRRDRPVFIRHGSPTLQSLPEGREA